MSIDQRIRDGLRSTSEALPPPDVDQALSAVVADVRRAQRRTLVIGLAAAAAVIAVVAGALALTQGEDDSQQPVGPSTPTPTDTITDPTTPEAIPRGPADVAGVNVRPGGLEVDGEVVPGAWTLSARRHDVWVAIKTDEDDFTSQWWGKGATANPMPPSVGDVLRGGVVISQDARWIVWTRPVEAGDDWAGPRVMEVVDTATGEVRWSRDAGTDAPEMGALAVTNDGVVVFGHCLAPVVDSGGTPQCDDARVDVWAPEADVVSTVPAGVMVGGGPFPDTVTTLGALVQATGAHNGLLVQRARSARPDYLRVTDEGDVEVVATGLPRTTVAVSADERFALRSTTCSDGLRGCGWSVVPLDGGEELPLPSLDRILLPPMSPYYGFVVERDDLVLVTGPIEPVGVDGPGPAVARCSLAVARCVPLEQ